MNWNQAQTTTNNPAATLPAAVIADAFSSAVAAAASFAGATCPNPPVGCVILDAQSRVLACEAHQRAGAPHAEAAAIAACRDAGAHDRIDTIIVTLEPCNHFGRTPPCVSAILATPAKTVWIGISDPNPHVAGRGAEILRKHGLSVFWLETLHHSQTPRLVQTVHRLAGPFAKWSATKRPWITLKQALTRDGSMIPPAGQKTFTSSQSLVLAHKLRRRADAIITGSGTILTDSPLFTVRHIRDHTNKRRHLAILDRRNRTPSSYLDAARARGLEVRLENDIAQTLDHLGEAGVLETILEAGPNIVSEFLQQDLWDEQIIIRQGADASASDIVGVVTRTTPFAICKDEDDVLWHH